MDYKQLLALNRPYLLHRKLSGKERLKIFLRNEVGSGNYFHPEEFKPHASMFGLKASSISATFDALLKAGVVVNMGSSAYCQLEGKRPAKLWKVV